MLQLALAGIYSFASETDKQWLSEVFLSKICPLFYEISKFKEFMVIKTMTAQTLSAPNEIQTSKTLQNFSKSPIRNKIIYYR